MKLSIVTINYNNKVGLQKTIDSVICQTWKDYEWIIIDGGSTDGSKALIEQYQQNFAYWCSEPDKGIYHAMNKGIQKAKGKYLQFLNSGDTLHSSQVLEQVFAETLEDDIIYGELRYVTKDSRWIVRYPQKLTLHYFLCQSIGHPASFIKATLFKENEYREDFKIISDWYNFYLWFRDGKSFRKIDVVIADYDTTGISSVNIDQINHERDVVFNELFGEENRKFIEESVLLQKIYEDVKGYGILPLNKYGHKRQIILRNFIKILNKTVKNHGLS